MHNGRVAANGLLRTNKEPVKGTCPESFKLPGRDVNIMQTQDRAHIVLWSEIPGELSEVKSILERHGHRIQTASSLEGALALAESGNTDLVIGWLCGGYNGPLKLLTRLQANDDAPPVLVVSCGLDVHLYLQAMQHGAFDCVAVPLNESELMRIISQALQSAALRLSV